MDRTRRDIVLGLVFFAGLALLLWATFNLGNLSLRPGTELTVRFPNAAGLREGDPVTLLGRRAGQVRSVGMDESNPTHRIVVAIQLYDRVELRTDATFMIKPSGLLAGQAVEIDPGTAPTRRDPSAPLLGRTSSGPFDSLSETFAGENNKADLSGALRGIRLLAEYAISEDGSLGRLLRSPALHDALLDVFQSARRLLEGAERGEGAIGLVAKDPEFRSDLARIGSNFREFSENLNHGNGLVPKLMNDPKLAQDGSNLIADASTVMKNLREGKGAVGALFSDPEVERDVRDTLHAVREVTRKANDPEAGAIGALFGDPKMLNSVRSFVDDIATLTDRVRNGDGLLGRLVNDREMGEKLDRIFTQVSRALEDAREAAPVGTIIQVLGGIF